MQGGPSERVWTSENESKLEYKDDYRVARAILVKA